MANNSTDDTRRSAPDAIFKGVLGYRFGVLNVPLQTQVEVSHLPRTMDALAVLRHKAHQDKVRLETPFDYVGIHNQIEFKGENDPLTIPGYRLILGRANLYMGENRVPATRMTISIVCAGKPRKVLLSSQDEVEFQSLGNGYYRSTDKLPVHVIVINELDITPKNYPFLMFASSKRKFQWFLRDAIANDASNYVVFAYYVKPQLTEEIVMASNYQLRREDLQAFKNAAGRELLDIFSVEERLEGLSLEERLEGLSLEDLIEYLRSRELSAEGRRQLQRLLDPQND